MAPTSSLSRERTNGFLSVSEEVGSSIHGASLNLLNSIVGAGIVAIPHAIQQCGLCLGLFLLIFLAYAICQIITVLMECGLKTGKLNLEELSGHFFGSAGYNVAACIMLLYAFGSMVACLVIIGDTLPPTLDDLFGAKIQQSRDEIVVIVSVCLVLPLSLVRHMSSLAFASGIAFFAVVVLVLGVLMVGPAEATSQGLSFDMHEDFTIIDKNIFRGIGVLSFHYVCQHSCLLIFQSLETPSMENVREVSRISLGVVLLFSLLIGIGGYVFFGQTTNGNILNNFHTQSDVIIIARLCMAVNMMFTYPMECFVVRHALWSLLNKYFPRRRSAYDRALSVSGHSSTGRSSDSVPLESLSVNSVCLGSIDSSETSGIDEGREEYNDDGVLLQQWSSIAASPDRLGRSTSSGMLDNARVSGFDHSHGPPTVLHFLLTLCLWAISLVIAIGFDDVSVVLALSGIVAASILGYILPVAIYLKTHEDKVQLKLASLGLGEYNKEEAMEVDKNSAEQCDFDRNCLFFVLLGVFGVSSLLVGLAIELMNAFEMKNTGSTDIY